MINILRPEQNGIILQMIFSITFCWKKISILAKISLKLFLIIQLTICQHWFMQWHGTEQVTSHYLMQCWPWFMGPSLGHNELIELQLFCTNSSNFCFQITVNHKQRLYLPCRHQSSTIHSNLFKIRFCHHINFSLPCNKFLKLSSLLC